jgi:hypothetical protein
MLCSCQVTGPVARRVGAIDVGYSSIAWYETMSGGPARIPPSGTWVAGVVERSFDARSRKN